MKSLTALLFCIVTNAQWPAPSTAMQAYDFVQEQRRVAGKLWGAKDPKGIAILNDMLAYLDQPLVRDLSTGNEYLAARRLNILIDLAQASALQGNRSMTLNYLRNVAKIWPGTGLDQMLANMTEFNDLRSSPEFAEVLVESQRYEHLWDSPALASKFQPVLTDAEKIAGLSKLWSEVKYNFAYPEKLTALNWDQLYLEWIPKVISARSIEDYYRQLILLCARIGDGHTNVYPPDQLDLFSRPPIRTLKVEDRVMIIDVMSPSMERQGIRVGMEILKIDGEPIIEYGRRTVEPFQSSSTPQDRELRSFSYGLLRGNGNTPVRLLLRNPDGAEKEHVLARKGYQDIQTRSLFEWKMLPGKIVVVTLNSFESNEVASRFKEEFPKFQSASAMILDLRWNGGGSSSVGYEILRRLIDKPVKTSRQVMRKYNPTARARGTLIAWEDLPASELSPVQELHFDGPAVVLTSAATFSAAEDFLVAWKNSSRGKIIGMASGGSTGQPLFFQLPGGGKGRVCTKRDTFPDGREWVGIGIVPDIEVHPTVRDIQAGKDTVLQRAVEFLNNKEK